MSCTHPPPLPTYFINTETKYLTRDLLDGNLDQTDVQTLPRCAAPCAVSLAVATLSAAEELVILPDGRDSKNVNILGALNEHLEIGRKRPA